MTRAPEVMNSYRLPHGAREAATVRATTANAWARVAMVIIATPILAAVRLIESVYTMSSDTNLGAGVRSVTLGPPAPTSSLALSLWSSASSLRIDWDAVAMSQEKNRNATR